MVVMSDIGMTLSMHVSRCRNSLWLELFLGPTGRLQLNFKSVVQKFF